MFPTLKESRFVGITESIKNLMQQQSLADVSNLIGQIYNEVRNLEENEERGAPDPKMAEYAVDLWNWGVTKRGEDAITEMERAMVRHVSCNLACWCEGSDQSEVTIESNVLMAMKTGKGWIDVGKPELANVFLERSLNSLEKLYYMMTQRSAIDTDRTFYKNCVEKELFTVLTYQAEAAVSQKDFPTAAARIDKCRDMLLRQPKQAVFLSILCYNFGVETYEDQLYEQSSFWLRQSFEIGRMNAEFGPGPEMQAKVLRLLATVYMDWDCKSHQDQALTAIKLANEEKLHPAGLFLKMKILLSCSLPDNVISMAGSEMLRHQLTLDVYLNTVNLLMEHGRDSVGFDFLNLVCTHFESTPDIEKALLLQIELMTTRGKELLARKKVEDLITGHYTGNPLSADSLNTLHGILWDCAAKSFQKKSYSQALEWYNYSLGIYATDCTEPNYAKLQRNRASCFLHLHELPKAREAVTAAEKYDPQNIFTKFILFRIAVLENSDVEAMNAVSTMAEMAARTDCRTPVVDQYYSATELLSLAAKIALENNQRKVAVKALQCVTELSQDTQQVFMSLRCLVRLTLSGERPEDQGQRDLDTETLMSYLNIAHRKLAEHLAWDGLSDRRIDEAHWFRKIAWNLAVGSRESPLLMRDFFLVSYKISLFCLCDKTLLVAQRSCLLMAAAVDLELARKAADHSEQMKLLVHSLESITLCREIWNSLKSADEFPNDNTEILLVLYEFEARAKLNDPALQSVVEYVWGLPNLDPKILESIASLSMEAPAYYPSICKKVLQGALSVLKNQDPPDVSRLSKCLHSLLKLSLPERNVGLEEREQEEAWGYYQEALCIITTADYPEMETLWLMTRAWNTGIYLYSVRKFQDAGRWCELAMRLLNYLGSLKSSYESKMTALYGDILDKLDKESGAQSKP